MLLPLLGFDTETVELFCLPELTLHDNPPVLFSLFQRTENVFCLWLFFFLLFSPYLLPAATLEKLEQN